MAKYLVGYTGFVGSNLYKHGNFDAVFNSKNIEEAFGKRPDLLIYAGVRAEKFLANQSADADFETMVEAFENIKKIQPKKLVLISTIDIYKDPKLVNENTGIVTVDLHPYGFNRYALEKMIRQEYPDCLIVRLPGLFGGNLKKNFIYDLIHIIPSMLTKDKYEELSNNDTLIKNSYKIQDNGFYKCKELDDNNKKLLKNAFLNCGFSALSFTDSRGKFQFYNLKYLYQHIEMALNNDIKLLNLATEPIKIADIYDSIYHADFVNEFNKPIPDYDFRTIHGGIFGRNDQYIFGKDEVLEDIKSFIEGELE